jgi:hypothetical protein
MLPRRAVLAAVVRRPAAKPRRAAPAHLRAWLLALSLMGLVTAPAQAQKQGQKQGQAQAQAQVAGATAAAAPATAGPLPSLAELEAAGARIGQIRIVNQNIFDPRDPAEDKWLFNLANALHIQTRTSVIEESLLFKSGEPLNLRRIE